MQIYEKHVKSVIFEDKINKINPIKKCKLLLKLGIKRCKYILKFGIKKCITQLQECANTRSSIKLFMLDGRFDIIATGSFIIITLIMKQKIKNVLYKII